MMFFTSSLIEILVSVSICTNQKQPMHRGKSSLVPGAFEWFVKYDKISLSWHFGMVSNKHLVNSGLSLKKGKEDDF